MEQSPGHDSVPAQGTVDKTKVLNVKPLRTLVPVFPSAPNFTSNSWGHQGTAPFVCVPPNGPFPPGVAPFYPFAGAPGPACGQSPTISAAVPISSYRAIPSHHVGAVNGGAGQMNSKSRRQLQVHIEDAEDDGFVDGQNHSSLLKSRSEKRARGTRDINLTSSDVDTELMVDNILASQYIIDISRRPEGDNETAGYILQIFDFLRRKVMQIEDSNEAIPGQTRRPDLKVSGNMMAKGIRANVKKRIGPVPGVEIGDIFFFRMEMCIIGLHAPSMAGIDYMGLKISQEEEPLAVSIVSSGGYDDNDEDEDTLIYSGQGGNLNRKDKEITDQKLERGNLALEKSLHRGNEVRVIRGIKDVSNPNLKVYVYDGLYKIQESWVEKGKSGCSMFKYKLVRLPNQPEAFKVWKSVQQWKDGTNPRPRGIIPDLTSGAEHLPVSLVNDVDDEKGPAYFTYSSSLRYSEPVTSKEPFVGCDCSGGCLPGNRNCSCIQRNKGYLPYVANGVLANQKSLIHECGPSCRCPPNCRNRVSQGGLKLRLEVFKTKDRGWGLRSWDPIRAGAFICEYAGVVISNSKTREVGTDNGYSYIFDSNRRYQPSVIMPHDTSDAPDLPFPIIIDAKDAGNVARFMNHSCSPNVFWQPLLRANSEGLDLHIVFHAIRHIPPMAELTFDYGMAPTDYAVPGTKRCLCGSAKCRGFFY